MMKTNFFYYALLILIVGGCVSLYNEYDEKVLENKEYDAGLKVQEIQSTEPQASAASATPGDLVSLPKTTVEPPKLAEKKVTAPKDLKAPAKSDVKAKASKHEPSIEDSVGFEGRRPLVDPFVEGEELTYVVSYFAVEGGRLVMKTRPFVQVNGRKSYHFSLHARSTSVFSLFYAVDDVAETFLDFEELIPYSYEIKAKESKQIRDVKALFNWQSMKAKTWDKKIKKGREPEDKFYEWQLLPYSQNVISIAYYMRCFQYEVGKELSVRVAHEGKNIMMTAKVLREEKLKTGAGVLDTYVIKPEFEIDGVFKPVGDVFMWITKDKYHRIARIESKIKIGKVVMNLEKISP